MKFSMRLAACLVLSVLGTNAVFSADETALQDAKAVEVLKSMAAHTAAMDQFVITGEVIADARLDAGLVVSNPGEITVKIDRPDYLHLDVFDGLYERHIYLNKGQLTVFGTETNFYAHAAVPAEIEEGMLFALEKLDVEAPLGELFFAETSLAMLLGGTEVMYLTDKSRVNGVDCHHIVVRGSEVDVQFWVEEGENPVPRKMLMTMKWESGSPRYSAVLNWEPVEAFEAATFDFKPPEGAMEIQFIGNEQEGE